MTTQEKALALKSLCDELSLRLDINDNWYVYLPSVEVGGDGFLTSAGSRGGTPDEAIEVTWKEITSLPKNRYLVLEAYQGSRRHVRWNGYMWQDLPVQVSA